MLRPGQRWVPEGAINTTHPFRAVAVVGFSIQYAPVATLLPQPVVVARVVTTPTLEVNRGILHPTTQTLVLRGRSLAADDLVLVFNTGIIKDTHYSIATNPNGTVATLSLLVGQRWLGSHTYGSMPLRVEQFRAHRGIYHASTEVGVAIEACLPSGGGNCGNQPFKGGLFVCDWGNRRLKQLTATVAAPHFGARATLGMTDFAAMSTALQDPKAVAFDRHTGQLYVAAGQAKPNYPMDATGSNFAHVFDFDGTYTAPYSPEKFGSSTGNLFRYSVQLSAAQSGGQLPEKKIRGPQGIAIHSIHPVQLQFALNFNFWSLPGSGRRSDEFYHTLRGELAMVLGVDIRRIQDLYGTATPQKTTLFTFLAVANAAWQASDFATKLQADIRNPSGRLHTKREGRSEEGGSMYSFQAGGGAWEWPKRIHNPAATVTGTVTTPRKFLYVASDEMNCVVRYVFADPGNPSSALYLAPVGYEAWWGQTLTNSPYSCIKNKCMRNVPTAPPTVPKRDIDAGKPPPPSPRDPPPEIPEDKQPKKCLQEDRSLKECFCLLPDDCLTRDSEICFSSIGGALTRPHTVLHAAADNEVVYVSSEEHASIVQLNATTGDIILASPSYGHYATGFAVNGRRHLYGNCRDDNPKDNWKHCTGPGNGLEESSMPKALRSVNCFHDAECNPDRINATFLA